MMINSKKLLFSLILGLSVSGAAFAQRDKNKPPDKEGRPPVVTPKEKPPPTKDEPKTKRPGNAIVLWKSESDDNA